MSLPIVPHDKSLHFLYGACIGLSAAVAATALGLPYAPQIGIGAAAAFGIGKEALDLVANRKAAAAGQAPAHGVELMDIVATAAGGVAVNVIGLLA